MTVRELLTDGGSPYRSAVHAIACRTLGLRRLRTKPHRPKTNGKACVSGSCGRPRWRRGSPRRSV
jgi:hypothetical protein